MLDTAPATENGHPVDYVIGDHFDDTATLPLSDVAKRLERDILDVQGDDLIVREAAFDVTAADSGPHGVVRVAVSGLATAAASAGTDSDVICDTIQSVFELASNYNRVERLRPDQCRFILAVDVMSDCDGIVGGFIGTMRFHDW
ncbi:hypothetical protein [Amycolatopsis orientalis]|uniref:hypothetical protein n=1 Tax=Amycolatopsis orientalis TaxID=31958 RepID=UPI00055C5E51|nr:hypothetical protein [Amycolatopsis orientalis]